MPIKGISNDTDTRQEAKRAKKGLQCSLRESDQFFFDNTLFLRGYIDEGKNTSSSEFFHYIMLDQAVRRKIYRLAINQARHVLERIAI